MDTKKLILAQAVYLTKLDSHFAHCVGFVLWILMSAAETLGLCTSCSLAKIPNLLHQHVNGEDEIANIPQVTPHILAVNIFHPLNVNKGLDITMFAAGNFTKYLPNCFLATATPLANTIAHQSSGRRWSEVDLL